MEPSAIIMMIIAMVTVWGGLAAAIVLILIGAIGGLFYAFVVDVWTVHADDPYLSASIAPTLEPGDVILAPNPSYPIHTFGFIIAGATIRAVPTTPDEH